MQLYNMLYLGKYSPLNVQFNENFIYEFGLQKEIFTIKALRNKHTNSIDAVLGYYRMNGVMTTPIFGYF